MMAVPSKPSAQHCPQAHEWDSLRPSIQSVRFVDPQLMAPQQAQSYTNYFADSLLAEAERDSRIIGIHAAMGGGTGMNRFSVRFPERTFDVGIAEQHAVSSG